MTSDPFSVGVPRVFLELGSEFVSNTFMPAYDVSPDGERFLMFQRTGGNGEEAQANQIHVVQNWHQELLERVPVP